MLQYLSSKFRHSIIISRRLNQYCIVMIKCGRFVYESTFSLLCKDMTSCVLRKRVFSVGSILVLNNDQPTNSGYKFASLCLAVFVHFQCDFLWLVIQDSSKLYQCTKFKCIVPEQHSLYFNAFTISVSRGSIAQCMYIQIW